MEPTGNGATSGIDVEIAIENHHRLTLWVVSPAPRFIGVVHPCVRCRSVTKDEELMTIV
jgi:hypothetical protein